MCPWATHPALKPPALHTAAYAAAGGFGEHAADGADGAADDGTARDDEMWLNPLAAAAKPRPSSSLRSPASAGDSADERERVWVDASAAAGYTDALQASLNGRTDAPPAVPRLDDVLATVLAEPKQAASELVVASLLEGFTASVSSSYQQLAAAGSSSSYQGQQRVAAAASSGGSSVSMKASTMCSVIMTIPRDS